MTDPVLDSAIAVRDRYAHALAEEEASIARLQATAVATKSSMPDNYWQKRHGLQCRLETANAMVEVLQETSGG